MKVTSLARPGRFKMLRAGIFNIWQYDSQVFHFHEGRLLLRGQNGTGKTKAMELLLPFLLDANAQPSRLDPAGQGVKTMKANLLDAGQGSRIGYTWIEFGRVDDAGAAVHLTIGAGLRATSAGGAGADIWYLVTSQRVGDSLQLLANDIPLTRERLRASIGNSGRVFDTATEYKAYVDQALFGLGRDRYQALVDLLVELRRPQLSKSLDPEVLTTALTASLPPLDEAVLNDIARAFAELEKNQADLASLKKTRDAVGKYLAEYQVYAKAIAKSRARRLVQAYKSHKRQEEHVLKAHEQHDKLKEAFSELGEELKAHKVEKGVVTARIGALQSSPEATQARRLEDLEELVTTLNKTAKETSEELSQAAENVKVAEGNRLKAAAVVDSARTQVRELTEKIRIAADAAGTEVIHQMLMSHFQNDLLDPAQERSWEARMNQRRQDIAAVERATAEIRQATARVEELEKQEKKADDRVRELAEKTKEAGQAVEDHRSQIEAATGEWHGRLMRLVLAETQLDLMLESLHDLDLTHPVFLSIPKEAAAEQIEEIRIAIREIESQAKDRQRQVDDLKHLVEELESAREIKPPPPTWSRTSRETRQGAPFYRLIEPRSGCGVNHATLEGALTGAGLLDAWVHPNGQIDSTVLDVALTPSPLPKGRTLLEVLSPVEAEGVPSKVIEAILGSVHLAQSAAPTGSESSALIIGEDGTWAFGVLSGRTEKHQVEYIGASAREARRQAEIRRIRADIQRVETELRDLERNKGDRLQHISTIRNDETSLPRLDLLRARKNALTAAARDEANARHTLAEAQRSAGEGRKQLSDRVRTRTDLARQKSIERFLDSLDTLRDKHQHYQDATVVLFRAVDGLRGGLANLSQVNDAASNLQHRQGQLTGKLDRTNVAAASQKSKLETLKQTAGAKIEELRRQLSEAKDRDEWLENTITGKTSERVELSAKVEGARLAMEQSNAELQKLAMVKTESDASLHFLSTGDLLAMALGERQVPTEPLAMAEAVIAATPGVQDDEEYAEKAANNAFRGYQRLMNELTTDVTAYGNHSKAIFVVTFVHQGKTITVPQMFGILEAEVIQRSTLLQDQERELIERHLFGEVSNQIRTRIREANMLVEAMNEQLAAHPTAGGLLIKLAWEVSPDIGRKAIQALALIRKSTNLLTDEEKSVVIDFLQECRRASNETTNLTGTEQLKSSLDYRRWHRFELSWKKGQDAKFARLTKSAHATGSAGEKAIAIYLPMFAAAAAHYKTAKKHAPRVVALDEAFAGVDQRTKGSAMGLLASFDMDVMMTAFNEWACYPDLPGLAIYHLERDMRPDGARGVLATPFIWDGKQRHKATPGVE